MLFDEGLCLHHIQHDRRDTCPLGCPASGIKRNGIDQSVRRHFFESFLNAVLHIADRSNTARFLTPREVLIIAHDNDVISKSPLFQEIIIVIKVVGHIVVDGNDQPRPAAGNTDLTHKLHEIFSVCLAQSLDVHIDSVQFIILRLGNNLIDDARSALKGLQKSAADNALIVLEIVEDSPDLHSLFVGFLNIT